MGAIVAIYAFLIAVCLSYGSNKSRNWQYTWLLITLLKCTLDISVKSVLYSVFVNYSIPNIISKDVQFARSILEASGLNLLRKNPAFHFNRFSSTDYFFSSCFVAKAFPDLLESKIVLMYRTAFPELEFNNAFRAQTEHGQQSISVIDIESSDSAQHCSREKVNCNLLRNNDSMYYVLRDMIVTSIISILLYLGTLDCGIQKLIVNIVSSTLLTYISVIAIGIRNDIWFTGIVSSCIIFLLGPFIVYFTSCVKSNTSTQSSDNFIVSANSMQDDSRKCHNREVGLGDDHAFIAANGNITSSESEFSDCEFLKLDMHDEHVIDGNQHDKSLSLNCGNGDATSSFVLSHLNSAEVQRRKSLLGKSKFAFSCNLIHNSDNDTDDDNSEFLVKNIQSRPKRLNTSATSSLKSRSNKSQKTSSVKSTNKSKSKHRTNGLNSDDPSFSFVLSHSNLAEVHRRKSLSGNSKFNFTFARDNDFSTSFKQNNSGKRIQVSSVNIKRKKRSPVSKPKLSKLGQVNHNPKSETQRLVKQISNIRSLQSEYVNGSFLKRHSLNSFDSNCSFEGSRSTSKTLANYDHVVRISKSVSSKPRNLVRKHKPKKLKRVNTRKALSKKRKIQVN